MEFFFCRHESYAGELQFFHPVATKITRDSREETSGASPRQPVPGEQIYSQRSKKDSTLWFQDIGHF